MKKEEKDEENSEKMKNDFAHVRDVLFEMLPRKAWEIYIFRKNAWLFALCVKLNSIYYFVKLLVEICNYKQQDNLWPGDIVDYVSKN